MNFLHEIDIALGAAYGMLGAALLAIVAAVLFVLANEDASNIALGMILIGLLGWLSVAAAALEGRVPPALAANVVPFRERAS